MKKIVQLEKGAIFAKKGGDLTYLTNEQLNRTGLEPGKDDRGNQIQVLAPDRVMYELKNQVPVEAEISAFLLGIEQAATNSPVVEKPKAAAKKKAVKIVKQDTPVVEETK